LRAGAYSAVEPPLLISQGHTTHLPLYHPPFGIILPKKSMKFFMKKNELSWKNMVDHITTPRMQGWAINRNGMPFFDESQSLLRFLIKCD